MKIKQNQEGKKIVFGSISLLVVIGIMIFSSEITKEKEIIFPEIAALCFGNFLMPRLIWKTSYHRMVFFITLCAIMGVLIVLYIPLPIWLQVTLAFAVGQIIFFFSGTSVAPMISAVALPVLIQTKSYVYIVSAFGLTVIVVFCSLLLEKGHVRTKNEGQKAYMPWKECVANFIFRTLIVLPVAYLCTHFDMRIKFCIAPPLLVAFTELTTNRASPPAKRPIATIVLFLLCSFLGSACRYILTIKCGLPLTLAALISMIGVVILMKGILKLVFPPAAAMCILAMLIPEEIILYYPLEVTAGITFLTVSAVLWRRILFREKKSDKENKEKEKEKEKENKNEIDKIVEVVIDDKNKDKEDVEEIEKDEIIALKEKNNSLEMNQIVVAGEKDKDIVEHEH